MDLAAEVEVLTIEVGSTITKVNGFKNREQTGFELVAQGFAPTSVALGDVGMGVNQAIADLEARLGCPLGHPETFINSSAAGGLRMSVHGLTYSMTARAAREAALGAGGIVKMITAGRLDGDELEEIKSIQPNIILLAGGVDYGEKESVLANAESLAALHLPVPVVYAGNIVLQKTIQRIFKEAGMELLIAANVFPEVDVLAVGPLRSLIQEVFNRHIIHAPGMARLSELTHRPILPTPGAVLKGAELFAEELGDCLVVDVGGATTDVHSVTDGSPEWAARSIEPEPHAKRTVEGDLGVFINAHHIVELSGDAQWAAQLAHLQAIPAEEAEINLTRWLCSRAVEMSMTRHAGTVTDLFTPTGKKKIVLGKDLSAVQWVIGTGGALTRIPGGEAILRSACKGAGKYLLPAGDTRILIDRDYLFSALGTLGQVYPEEVKKTFRQWVSTEALRGPAGGSPGAKK